MAPLPVPHLGGEPSREEPLALSFPFTLSAITETCACSTVCVGGSWEWAGGSWAGHCAGILDRGAVGGLWRRWAVAGTHLLVSGRHEDQARSAPPHEAAQGHQGVRVQGVPPQVRAEGQHAQALQAAHG